MKLNKFRQEIAEKFIAALNEDIIPWHKEWQSLERPINAVTNQKYHGNNMFWLSYIADEKKYDDPRWCTYKQAHDKGWIINKGEKGTKVEFFTIYDKQEKKNISGLEAEALKVKLDPKEYQERINIVNQVYIVFNAKQMTGIPPLPEKKNRNILHERDLKEVRDKLKNNMGVGFVESEDIRPKAAYYPIQDLICMPKISYFESDYAYMSTFLHEAAHATGKPARMNRTSYINSSFGSEEYAKEELRAEIASAFTAQLINIPYVQSDYMENHKAYIQSWISVLKNNPNELFKAIKDAEKISDYLIEKGELIMEKDIIEDEEAFVEGIEFAIDSGLMVSDKDFKKYKEITDSRSIQVQKDIGKGRSL